MYDKWVLGMNSKFTDELLKNELLFLSTPVFLILAPAHTLYGSTLVCTIIIYSVCPLCGVHCTLGLNLIRLSPLSLMFVLKVT